MDEMAFDRAGAIAMIVRRISMLSNENLLKLIMLDVNIPIEVNETVRETNFIPVREMTDKTRKAIDEALASGDPVGPFDNVDEAMDWLFNKSEDWEKSH